MRCGHCKADGVDRAHVRACSSGGTTAASEATRLANELKFDPVSLAVAAAAGEAADAELLAELNGPAIPTPHQAAVRAGEAVAANAARVRAGNGGEVQAVGGPLPAEPTHPPANPATDKQRAFLRRLANERAVTDDGSDPRPIAVALGDQVEVVIQALSKREASKLIDAWMELPLAGPQTVEDAGAPELAAGADHLARGRVHVLDGTYYRIHVGQRSGKPYAVRAIVGRTAVRDARTGELVEPGVVEWEYAPKVTWKLRPGTLATAAEAAAFGELVGRCVFCSTPIDTPESTSRGYGPVCAEKNGLPWG